MSTASQMSAKRNLGACASQLSARSKAASQVRTIQIEKYKRVALQMEKHNKAAERRSSIAEKQKDLELVEINNRLNKITKWSRFKQQREQAIKNYLLIKRKSSCNMKMVVLIKLL